MEHKKYACKINVEIILVLYFFLSFIIYSLIFALNNSKIYKYLRFGFYLHKMYIKKSDCLAERYNEEVNKKK